MTFAGFMTTDGCWCCGDYRCSVFWAVEFSQAGWQVQTTMTLWWLEANQHWVQCPMKHTITVG